MKSISLFKVLFLLLFSVTIVSCNKDDDNPAPEPPLPTVPTYKTSFDISLGYTIKVTDTETKQVLVDVDYGIADVNTLVYVIHRESDGHFFKLNKMNASVLKNSTTDNIATVKDTLPEGKYYITFVAFKDFVVEGSDVLTFFKPLTKNYDEAVMQIPNDYVHYATTEFEVSANDGANKPVPLDLKKLTTDLILEFTDADKVANSSRYRLNVGVEKIPSAFFIASGKTLSAKETEENKLYFYSGEQNVPLYTSEGHKKVVAVFHSLSNDNLQPSDRGKYWFEFKETLDSGKPIRAVSKELDEFSASFSFSMYAYGLFDKQQALVKSFRKIE